MFTVCIELSPLLGLLIFLNMISDMECPAELVECEASEYNEELQMIPLDSGSSQSRCKQSIEELTKIYPDNFLTNKSLFLHIFHVICNTEGCFPLLSSLLKKCHTKLKPTLNLACATNGEFQCWSVLSFEDGKRAQELCYSTDISGEDTCSMACKNEIVRVADTSGCCFNNIFNSSLFGSQLLDLEIANGSLWDKCKVDRLNYCSFPEIIETLETESAKSSHQMISLTLLRSLLIYVSVQVVAVQIEIP